MLDSILTLSSSLAPSSYSSLFIDASILYYWIDSFATKLEFLRVGNTLTSQLVLSGSRARIQLFNKNKWIYGAVEKTSIGKMQDIEQLGQRINLWGDKEYSYGLAYPTILTIGLPLPTRGLLLLNLIGDYEVMADFPYGLRVSSSSLWFFHDL